MVRSVSPLTSVLPSGAYTIRSTQSVSSMEIFRDFAVRGSQNRMPASPHAALLARTPPSGRECYRINVLRMSLKSRYLFPGARIPQTNRVVVTPSSQCFAIGRERYRIDIIPMSYETDFMFTRVGIPQPRGIIITRSRKRFTIRAKRYRIDRPPYAP